jgi:hypothetical protein
MDLTSPTPYTDVNQVLALVLNEARQTLAEQFLGMYLYGSLASGDFNSHTSDVDFLVVTSGLLPHETVQALEAMHARIEGSGLKWAAKLEGAYIARSALRRWDPGDATAWPMYHEGRFSLAVQGADWVIQRHILREYDSVVSGPSIRPWIDPVTPGELRQSVGGILQSWWAPMLQNPEWIKDSEYQAFAALSMCRALHTLRFGVVASKPHAARWAIAALGDPWAVLAQRALAWRGGQDLNALPLVLEFIRYTLERYAEGQPTLGA